MMSFMLLKSQPGVQLPHDLAEVAITTSFLPSPTDCVHHDDKPPIN